MSSRDKFEQYIEEATSGENFFGDKVSMEFAWGVWQEATKADGYQQIAERLGQAIREWKSGARMDQGQPGGISKEEAEQGLIDALADLEARQGA